MKKIWLLWGIITLVWACDTEQKVIDTGVSNPYFDGTIMDYLRSNNKNWDLTVEMIEHAGLTDLFEGRWILVRQSRFGHRRRILFYGLCWSLRKLLSPVKFIHKLRIFLKNYAGPSC